MASSSSFDVVNKLDKHELSNAVQQASKEVSQRFDFRGTGAAIELGGESTVTVHAETEERARAAVEVLKEKLVRRKLSLKTVEFSDPQTSGKTVNITGEAKDGIDQETAKKISKAIRQDGPKGVQAQINGDQLRVTGKKRDDLQTVIQLLKDKDFEVPLQFTNYR